VTLPYDNGDLVLSRFADLSAPAFDLYGVAGPPPPPSPRSVSCSAAVTSSLRMRCRS
jgi:hypothetical protein